MRHKQIGSAVCSHGSKRIGIGFAQMRNEQFSKKITWTPTSIRHTTNELRGCFSVRLRKIRAHWMKRDSLRFNFLAVKRRRAITEVYPRSCNSSASAINGWRSPNDPQVVKTILFFVPNRDIYKDYFPSNCEQPNG